MVREFSLLEYYEDYVNEIVMGFNSQFNTIQELYDFIQNEAGYTIDDCNTDFEPELWKNNGYTKTRKAIDIIRPDIPMKKTRAGETLEYSFGSQTLWGYGNTKYYEVKVRIKANDSSTYFDEGAFRIKFNTKAFGAQIANNVQVTLGANFNPTTYANIQRINKSDSVFSIWIKEAVSPYNRTKILPTNQLLCTLKIPLDSCNYPSSVLMDTFASVLSYSYFTPTQNGLPSIAVQYDSVNANDTRSGSTCEPTIYSVGSLNSNSDTVGAGINQKIKITGIDFGNTRGKIYLPNADKGAGNVYTKLDEYDINSWSDTTIIYTLPQQIDSGLTQSGGYIRSTPGTGVHRIANKWGVISDTTSTFDTLFIKYAINQRRITGGGLNYKNKTLLVTPFNDSAYTFKMHNSITNPAMKQCIKAAINKWRCLVGVNFKLDEAPVSTIKKDDDTCVIMINNLDSTTLASTYSFTKYCSSSSLTEPPPYKSNIDIVLNTSKVPFFHYDTTGTDSIPTGMYDFYAIMIHELGHALGLMHVLQKFDLMYPHSDIGPISSANRKIYPNYFNQEAGDTIMVNSTDLSLWNYNCSATLYPQAMQDTNCRVDPLGTTKRHIRQKLDVNIYPNPTYNILHIDLLGGNINNANYYILDVSGKLIQKGKLQERQNVVQLNGISNGVYFVKIQNNNLWVTKKIMRVQ